MELNVTHMVEQADDMPILSGSVAELGSNAGKITWNNSMAFAAERPLLSTDEERNAARQHFQGYGAWTREEIAAWSEAELQAIVCQEVAAQIREMEMFDTEEEYVKAAERGTVSGRLGKGDDGQWYCYFGD